MTFITGLVIGALAGGAVTFIGYKIISAKLAAAVTIAESVKKAV